MHILAAFLLLLSLVVTALALEATVPLILWSSKIITIPRSAEAPLQTILRNKNVLDDTLRPLLPELCVAKPLLIIDQPGIYTSDLTHPALSEYFSTLNMSVTRAATHLTVPHIRNGFNVDGFVSELETQCGVHVVQIDPADIQVPVSSSSVVFLMRLPPVGPTNAAQTLSQNDRALKALLEILPSNYIAIYTVSPAPTVLRTRTRNQEWEEGWFTPGLQMGAGAVLFFGVVLWGGLVVVLGMKVPIRYEDPKAGKRN